MAVAMAKTETLEFIYSTFSIALYCQLRQQ